MAEYYPLLARAVAALPNSNPESRRSIYDRARAALLAQLRAVQPPIAEEDIDRESRMLDEAISQLEAEAAAALAAQAAAPAVEAPASPQPASTAPDVTTVPDAPKRAEPLVKRPDPDAAPPRLAAPRPLSSTPGLPPRPLLSEKGPGALEAARQRLANLARSASARPASRVVVPPPLSPPPSDSSKPSVAFSVPVPGARFTPPRERHEVPAQELPAQELPAEPVEDNLTPATGVEDSNPVVAPTTDEAAEASAPVLRKYGPRAEAAGTSADYPPPDVSAEDQGSDDDSASRGPSHPAAPLPPPEKTRNLRPVLIGLPVILVVAAIAVFAYMRRDNPDDMARLRPAPGAETSEVQQGKIVERIGGGTTPVQRPNTTPMAPNAQPMQQSAPTTGTPVAQRAALLLDAPDDPDRVKTFVGNVVWRLDNVSRGPGQALAVGVRAEIDLPEAKLKAVMLIQKNTDETLPASHTIELRFIPAEGSPVPGVLQIQTPQLRREDTPSGDALMGVPAPILRNYFLVGLSRGDVAVSRNVDLIRNRGWFDVPMLLSDQRLAKITFEKGSAGERIINEAFDAWK